MDEFRIRNLLIGVAGLLIIFVADHLGIFAGLNTYCYNLAFRFRGPDKPSGDIVIAAIDEKTLGKMGRWPLERSRYAELLDALRDARVVGFTIIMAEPTVDDAILARSAARFGRAVFPSYIDNRRHLQLPSSNLARIPAGHIHIEQDISGQSIAVFTDLRLGNSSQPAFASLIGAIAAGSLRGVIPAARPPEPNHPTEQITQSAPMRINYCGPPGTFPAVSVADILAGSVPPGQFRDKIVLVGVTAAGIGEGLLTPFSQNRDRMSSVEVQANIVNNLLNLKSIRLPGEGTRLLAYLVMSFSLFVVFMFLAETGATMVWLSSLAGLTVTGLFLFSHSRIWVEPAVFLISATFLYLMTFLFKLDHAAIELQGECSAIALHLGPDAVQHGERKTQSGLFGHLSLGGINRKIAILGEATRQLIQRSKEKEIANRELEKKHGEVSELKAALEERVTELETALARVRQLEEMIPICMYCKKIRDDKDYWQRLECYFAEHTDIVFTHSICPECYQEQIREIEEMERREESISDTCRHETRTKPSTSPSIS